MTKYEPKTAFESPAFLKRGTTAPVINGQAIDLQSRWVVITGDGRIAARNIEDVGHALFPDIRNIRIVSCPAGNIIAIAPGMEDLTIPFPASENDERDPLDETWALMGRVVSRECDEWLRRYLGAHDLHLVEIDFTLAFMEAEDEYEGEVGDDLALFGESDFAASSRQPQHSEYSHEGENHAVREGVTT